MKVKEELLQKALEWAESAEKFLSGEIPIFVNELITFYTAKHIFVSIFLFLLILFGVLLISKGIKMDKEGHYNEGGVMMAICGGGLGVISLIPMIFEVIDLMKITLAPRLYLIEKLSELL